MSIFNENPGVRTLLVAMALGTLAAVSPARAKASAVAVTPVADPVAVRWRQTYDEPEAEIEHLAGTLGVDGDLWLVVGRRDDGVLRGPHELELWRIQAGDGQRTRMAVAWDGAPAIQSQRPMQMLATPKGVAIALQTDNGAYVVVRSPGAGPVVHGPVTAALDDALVAVGTDSAGQLALMTVRGLVSLDQSNRSWLLRWKKPSDMLIVAAAAAGPGRFGLVSTRIDDKPGNMSLIAVDLPADRAVSTQATPLAPGSGYALGKSLLALGNGGFALADPFVMDSVTRWQLTTVDANLNIVGSAVTEIPAPDMLRARLAEWSGKLLLLAPSRGATGGTAFVADNDGRLSPLALRREAVPIWRNTTRLDLYPLAGGNALLVESAHVLDDNARTTRSEVSVTRLLNGAATPPAPRDDHSRQGNQP